MKAFSSVLYPLPDQSFSVKPPKHVATARLNDHKCVRFKVTSRMEINCGETVQRGSVQQGPILRSLELAQSHQMHNLLPRKNDRLNVFEFNAF